MSRTSGFHLGTGGDCTGAIGGKPPPTLERVHTSKCGRGLAPDEAGGFTADLQSNMNSASLLNCAANRFGGIGRPNK